MTNHKTTGFTLALCLLIHSCNYSNSTTQNLQFDGCKEIELKDTLYQGLQYNMTVMQYNERLKILSGSDIVNLEDTSVTISLSDGLSTEKFILKIIPTFDSCYLEEITLLGTSNTHGNENLNYKIDELMTKKYGQGQESGYEELIYPNGEHVFRVFGNEDILIFKETGAIYSSYTDRLNDKLRGRRSWNEQNKQISMSYDENKIKINFNSIAGLSKKFKKQVEQIKYKDSINDIELKKSKERL